MAEGIFDFHTMREACVAAKPEGWEGFLRAYAPLAGHLLQHYARAQSPGELLPKVFAAAKAEENTFWRSFTGTGEKEFLLHFRGLVMAVARSHRGGEPETALTVEHFGALLQQFPLLQRELLLLALHGYQPEQLSEIIEFTPATVREVAQQARDRLQGLQGTVVGEDLFSGGHDRLFVQIEALRGDNCLPDRTHVRIAEGQISWREREVAERHLGECLFCLNRSAEYREVSHYYRVLPAAEQSAVVALAATLGLPVAAQRQKTRSLWQRVLDR